MNQKTCKDCKYFLGMGDWNLCCSKKYGLCYENTEACELFVQKEDEKALERMKEDEKDNI